MGFDAQADDGPVEWWDGMTEEWGPNTTPKKDDPGVWVAIGFPHDFYESVDILGAFRAREAAVQAILDAAKYNNPVRITESAVFLGAVCLGRVQFCVLP